MRIWMINETIIKIRENPLLYQYLKYHSYWYKILLRDSTRINEMILKMKEEYKLTAKDKIDMVSKRISMIRNLLEVFR